MMDPSSGLDQGSRLQIAAYLRNAEDISVTALPDRKTELRRVLLLSVLLLLVAFPAGLSLYRWRAKRARH